MSTMTTRNPENTRKRLLQAAFDEIYSHGYQGMRVDDILKRTGLRKGAFYHHFASKHELGCAVVDEIINGEMGQRWVSALDSTDDPINAIKQIMQSITEEKSAGEILLGCPLNNLAMEMSAQDDAFRERIMSVFERWIGLVAKAFQRGQAADNVRKDVDAKEVAMFIVASFEGCVSLSKAAQNPETFVTCSKQIFHYLDGLRT